MITICSVVTLLCVWVLNSIVPTVYYRHRLLWFPPCEHHHRRRHHRQPRPAERPTAPSVDIAVFNGSLPVEVHWLLVVLLMARWQVMKCAETNDRPRHDMTRR